MNTRIEVIQKLIDDNWYKRYLEIGYGSGECFRAIKCANKICVDPYVYDPGVIKQTSDEFFAQNVGPFDIVFVDGLHHADQVRKDIINASRLLTKHGAIAMHDINPKNREAQEVPCNTPYWNGDCWRAWVGLKKEWTNIETKAYRFDHGIGVIFPKGSQIYGYFEDKDMTYEEFDKTRDKWL